MGQADSLVSAVPCVSCQETFSVSITDVVYHLARRAKVLNVLWVRFIYSFIIISEISFVILIIFSLISSKVDDFCLND
jgi:hypothetical protein